MDKFEFKSYLNLSLQSITDHYSRMAWNEMRWLLCATFDITNAI
jgi:hypothetical protein